MSTFRERFYNPIFVREFCSEIAFDRDKLENLVDFDKSELNVYMKGKEFKMTVANLGNPLSIEYRIGEFEIPKAYDLFPIWEVNIGMKEKHPSKNYASEIKNSQLRICH